MPMVTISMFSGRDHDQKAAIADGVSAAISEHARVEKEDVWVRFDDVKRADWFVGGHLYEGGDPTTGA